MQSCFPTPSEQPCGVPYELGLCWPREIQNGRGLGAGGSRETSRLTSKKTKHFPLMASSLFCWLKPDTEAKVWLDEGQMFTGIPQP
jgi:hypothetical protein